MAQTLAKPKDQGFVGLQASQSSDTTMIRACLALSVVVALVAASPVVEVEERGLISDLAVGMLVGKIQEMLGITTTPKPGIFGLGILPIGPDGTTAAPTEEEK